MDRSLKRPWRDNNAELAFRSARLDDTSCPSGTPPTPKLEDHARGKRSKGNSNIIDLDSLEASSEVATKADSVGRSHLSSYHGGSSGDASAALKQTVSSADIDLEDDTAEQMRIDEQRRRRTQLLAHYSAGFTEASSLRSGAIHGMAILSSANASEAKTVSPISASNTLCKSKAKDGGSPELAGAANGPEDEDIDDMFSTAATPFSHKNVTSYRRIDQSKVGPSSARQEKSNDGRDDADGYYRLTLGERIGPDQCFHVYSNIGRGVFSEVFRARDTRTEFREHRTRDVAIKIVRSQDSMYKAALKEIRILQKLAAMDPEDKRHIVRLISHFEYKEHLCMVFESLDMNLREVIQRFGRNVGLNLRAVRAYTHQIFLALALLRKAEIIHADLKPDNILVNETKTVLKICDLGSASELKDSEITPYLVSRFYRAPEIILGQPHDYALDVWSAGCTAYELYTGKVLFPGKSNAQMLLLMQDLKGKLTNRQLRRGHLTDRYFDTNDKALDCRSTENIPLASPSLKFSSSDMRSRLLPKSIVNGLSEDDLRLTANFVDLLDKALELDPVKRITPFDALRHPFLTS